LREAQKLRSWHSEERGDGVSLLAVLRETADLSLALGMSIE
jgi:hypothetical protein